MDNALASKNELNLAVGVTLTSEQVAALTHDIVWMEERVVDGQKVLVPVLYLAQAESRNVRGSSLIQGRDLEMIAGNDLVNVGTLRATNNLSADVKGSLYNGGLVEANERLSVMATDSIRNGLAGDIRGNQLSLSTLKGDIVNDRTAVTYSPGQGLLTSTDDGGSVSARDTLSIKSGRDLTNSGTIISGADANLSATRDINLLAVQDVNEIHKIENGGHRSTVTTTVENLASSVKSGGNLKLDAGRDINVLASTAEAKGNLTADAKRDIFMSSAGDENNVETHSKDGKKRVHEEDNHTVQKAAEFIAGGDVKTNSGHDTTLVASKISAGNEAYVYAGNDLNLLAAQNKDYTLYDMKEKGGFGAKKMKRDEVTQITHVGSEINAGGDLSLVSEGDQRYQGAKLNSGKDLTLDSGGSITFEAVKDSHQESHDKSSSSAAWTSMESKGQVDETLRQSQLTAKGRTLVKAVDGLHIDIKQINQQSVSQAIDAMVQADPSMAWLKDAEARTDVDWRQVQELHDHWNESHSGLGGPAMIIIIIIVTYFTAGAASGLVGAGATAGSGTAMSAGLAATATSEAVAAGWANAALTAMITSAASTAAVSTINNKGDVGAALKETFSTDNLKNYIVAGGTAGLTAGIFNDWTQTTTGTSPALANSTNGALANTGKVIVADSGGLSSLQGIAHFTENQLLQNSTSALLNKALGREGSLGDAVQKSLVNAFTAYGFNLVGDIGVSNHLQDGGLEKIGLHALMGGLSSLAAGGDFKTGALAAGVNEAFVDDLASAYSGMSKDDRERLLLMNSQLIGVLTTAVQDPNADADKLQLGSSIAQSGTQYNYLSHQDVEDLEKALKECKDNCDAVRAEFAKRDADNTARLNNCWATGDCAKIKAEIDEGSLALNELWQNDKTGITDQFLHSNIADSTNARTRASLDHLPKGDPANAVKLLAAAGIIALAPEAIGLLGQFATRGAATCAANPVLCVNEVGIWAAEAGMSEALPVGLGVAAGGVATKELSDLRSLMEIEAKTGVKLTADEIAAVVGPAATGAKGLGKDYVDILSPEAKQHILYGDKPGSGGHMWPGQEGKTVFPESWSGDKIVDAVGDIATSPSTKWYAQTGTGGAYTAKGDAAKWVAYETRDGVRMRVVYQPATGKVVTAFPDDAPIPPYKPIK